MRRRSVTNQGGAVANTATILEFTVSGNNETAQLGRYNNTGPTGYDCTIDWGDGSPLDTIDDDGGALSHIYADSGVYQVKIEGRYSVQPTNWMKGTSVSGSGITDIIDWGSGNDIIAGHSFEDCTLLTNVTAPASTMNTTLLGIANAILMSFEDCTNIVSMDLDFDFSPCNVNRPTGMSFQEGLKGTKLTSYDISGWGVNYANFAAVFQGCSNATSITVDSRIAAWSNNTTLSSVFRQCSALTTVIGYENMCQSNTTTCLFFLNATGPISYMNFNSWDVSGCTSFQGFMNNSQIQDFDMDQWVSTTRATLRQMFWNLDNGPSTITLGSIKPNSCQEMFENSNSTITADMLAVDFSTCYNFQEMFRSAPNVTTFLQNLGTTTITGANVNFQEMFRFANSIGFGSTFTLPTCTISSIRSCFYGARWQSIDFTNATLQGVSQNFQNLFYDCEELETTTDFVNFLQGASDISNFGACFFDNKRMNQTLNMPVFDYNTCNNSFNNVGISSVIDVSNMNIIGSAQGMFQNFNGTVTGIDQLDISNVTTMTNFLVNRSIDTAQYDAALIYWDSLTIGSTFTINMGNSNYTLGGAAEAARVSLTGKGFSISDGGGI